MDNKPQRIYEFGDFWLDAAKSQLLRDGRLVPLNSKTFEMLLVLVENHGRLLTKDDLLRLVWPDQFVEESNLTVNMSQIRKALGEQASNPQYIRTISGKGYRFVADVRESGGETHGLIIEQESFSRVTVEQEEIINGNAAPLRLRPGKSFPWTTAIPLLLLAAVVFGAAGYMFYNRESRSGVSSEPASPMTIERVTDGGANGAASISPDGKFIAYGQNATSGAGRLFVQQTDTNTPLQLLESDNRQVGCINFSPDSSLIYYKVTDARDPHGALYSVSVLGKTPKRVLENFYGCPSLSPDGNRIAFYRDDAEHRQKSLIVSELESDLERHLLTRTYDELTFGSYPAWHPDGRLIAFASDPHPLDLKPGFTIFGVGVEDGAVTQLTTEQFTEFGKLAWTSDGRDLVFVAKQPRKENQLYRMGHPSGEVRRITNDLESYGNSGLGIAADSNALVADIWRRVSEVWMIGADGDTGNAVRVKSGTTNGRFGIAGLTDGRIAYVSSIGNNLDIRTVKDDGTDDRLLTSDSFSQKDVAASPDGRYLVFTSDQTGENRLFRMNADNGSDITQLTFGTASDSQPDISPDGRWVVYTSWDGKQNTVWKIPLMGGESQKLTDYESISPVFSPDGQTIACVLPSDTRAEPGNIALIPAGGGKPTASFQVMPFTYFPIIRWTPDGQSVVFRNWQKGVHNLWRQPLSGGSPIQLTNFTTGEIWNFAYSRDGNRILLSSGNTSVNVVLIKNFRKNLGSSMKLGPDVKRGSSVAPFFVLIDGKCGF